MQAAFLSLASADADKGLATALELRTIAKPPPPPAGQVTVRIKHVGICGSDVHYWVHGAIGDFIMKKDMLIGHECSGVVEAVGDGVTHLHAGDRVALEPGIPCGSCTQCRNGRYNLCPQMSFFATPPIDGSLCEFVNHPAAFAFKLPDSVPTDVGALLEPLAVGVYACRRGGVTTGSRVLILGAGPIGLVSAIAARAAGAAFVAIADISAPRVAFAKGLSSVSEAIVIQPNTSLVGDQRPDFANSFDCVLECCGVDSALSSAIDAAAPGGVVMAVGMGKALSSIPLLRAACKEVDIRGVFRYRHCYPAAVGIAAAFTADLQRFITHRFGFEQAAVEEGFATSRKVWLAMRVLYCACGA